MAGLSAENPFRNVFNEKVIRNLAESISKNYKQFNKLEFQKECLQNIKQLGFLERSHQICDALHKYLPESYPEAIRILTASLGSPLADAGKTDWDSFIIMPQTEFVSRYGKKYYELSMKALYEMTQRFSAENDLRTFLEIDFHKTMKILTTWTKDSSPHVRRLVSEGTRPRLPMTGRIKIFQSNPEPLFDLLENLLDDPSLYVRRSVANNLNDISKDNPELLIKKLQSWDMQKSRERQWIVKHALRSLVKKGHADALQLSGADTHADAEIKKFQLSKKNVMIGDELSFSFTLKNTHTTNATYIVDYDVQFIKANGDSKSKRFKLRKLTLKALEEKKIEGKFKAVHTSGRTIYPGKHFIQIFVNGQPFSNAHFQIL